MKCDLNIQASDTEPGVVVFTIGHDGRTIIIPLKGLELQRFAAAFATASMTAFSDQVLAAIAAIDEELISRENTNGTG